MNICMITTTLPPVVGGLETHVWDLSRQLAAAGHSVTLIGTLTYRGQTFPEYEEKSGVEIYRVRDNILPVYYFRYRLYALQAARIARRLHRKHRFDIVHIHQVYPAGISGALLKRLYRIPLAVTVHGSSLIVNWEVPWIRPLLKWVLKKSDLLLAVGWELREKLIACGVPESRIRLVPNTVDTDKFNPANQGKKIRQNLGWSSKDVVAAYVGRLSPPKGPRYFMELARRLLEKKPDLRFLVVGAGELEAEFRRQAETSGHSGSLAIIGGVSYDFIPDYLGAADILVVPSLWEPGGRSCLEGMAMGKPVVANRVGGMAELIEDGETGFLIETDFPRSRNYDAVLPESYMPALERVVEKLAADSTLRERVGANARREAETRYSLSAGAETIVSLYEQIRKTI